MYDDIFCFADNRCKPVAGFEGFLKIKMSHFANFFLIVLICCFSMFYCFKISQKYHTFITRFFCNMFSKSKMKSKKSKSAEPGVCALGVSWYYAN